MRNEFCSIPTLHSLPRVMECPKPGFQQSEFDIQHAVFVIFLQKVEADLVGGIVLLSQESTATYGRYLSFKTECQIHVCVMEHQRVLVARA